MSNSQNASAIPNRTPTSKQNGNQDPRPPEVLELLGKVATSLDAGHPQKALELLQKSKVRSPWVTNAMGVCLLRLGDTTRAIEMFKGLAVTSGVCFRTDVPAVFITNFATALLLAHNVSGCVSAWGPSATIRTPAYSGFAARFTNGRRGSLSGRRSAGIGETPPATPLNLASLPARSDVGWLFIGYRHSFKHQPSGKRLMAVPNPSGFALPGLRRKSEPALNSPCIFG